MFVLESRIRCFTCEQSGKGLVCSRKGKERRMSVGQRSHFKMAPCSLFNVVALGQRKQIGDNRWTNLSVRWVNCCGETDEVRPSVLGQRSWCGGIVPLNIFLMIGVFPTKVEGRFLDEFRRVKVLLNGFAFACPSAFCSMVFPFAWCEKRESSSVSVLEKWIRQADEQSLEPLLQWSADV